MTPTIRSLVPVLLLAASLNAATWSGAGADTHWSTAGNWDTVPSGTVALTFAGTSGLSNDNDLSGLVASGITFGAGAGAFVLGGDALTTSGAIAITNNSTATQTLGLGLTLSGNLTVNAAAGDVALTGALSETANVGLGMTGSGTVRFSGTGGLNQLNASSGAFALTGGAWTQAGTQGNLGLIIGSGSGATGVVNVTGGTHTFGGDAFTNAVRIGANGGSGALNISGGTVTVGTGVTGSGAAASINLSSWNGGGANNNGTLTLSGTGILKVDARILAGANGSTASLQNAVFSIQDSAQLVFSGSGGGSNGAGWIQIGGSGTGVVTNTFNFNGGTITGYGINTSAANSQSTLNFNGTQFIANATGATFGGGGTANWLVQSGGFLINTNGFNATLNASLTNGTTPGQLVKSGAGTLTISAGQSSFTGGVSVTGGTLIFNTTDVFGNATSGGGTVAVTAGNGATIGNTGGFNTFASVTLNGATLTANGGTSAAYQAFKLAGSVVATGNSTINSTTSSNVNNQIHIGNNAAGSQTNFNVVNTSDTLTVSAVLRNGVTGTGGAVVSTGLIKSGAGTMTLSGANVYTGATTVSAGTLLVNGSTAASAATVNGGVFGGTGTHGGTLTVNSGGTLRGGAGAASGMLTVAGAVTLASGSVVQLALSGAGAHSSIAANGGIAFDANQSFAFLDLGATTGTYASLITGVGSNPGTGSWTISNAGWSGTFVWNSGTQAIDLTLAAVPEPAVHGLAGAGALAALAFVRRRRKAV